MAQALLQSVQALESRLHDVKRLLTARPVDGNLTELTPACLDLLKVAKDLEYVALGPVEWLKVTLATDKYEHLCYYMIYQFNIHRSVPLDGEISYEELSQACTIPVDALTRLLRHAMLHRLFKESRSGYVAHSEASRIFVIDPTMASWMGHNYDEVFRSLIALPDALRKYPAASDPGHTAAALTFNQPRGFFGGLLQDEPWRAVRFAEAMQALTRGSYDPSHLVDGYDWGKHAGGLIVDVGGSSGFQTLALAKAFPSLRFIVQDIEDHSTKLQEHLSEAGCSSSDMRMQFQIHDFFQPNPQTSADVYFLRHIIHDWADEYAVKILRNIASVMQPNARIVIMDTVVPERGVLAWYTERMISFMDLQMLVMVNGKERNKEEWDRLLSSTHSKLRILNIKQPPNSIASVIEIGLID